MDNKQTVNRFYEEIWNKKDKSQIPELCHIDFSFRGSVGDVKRGYAGFAEYVDFITNALGDYRCEIIELIAEDNKAFARMRFSGIHQTLFLGFKPSQQRVEWSGAALFTFKDSKISDLWVLGDIHGLMQQLSPNSA